MLKSFKTTKLTSFSPRDKVHRSSTPAYVRDRTGVFAFKKTHQNKNPRVSKHAVQYLTRKSCDLNRICSLKLLLKATNMTWSFWQLWQIRFHLPESQPCSFNCNYGHIMIPMLGKAPSHGARQRNKALLQINLLCLSWSLSSFSTSGTTKPGLDALNSASLPCMPGCKMQCLQGTCYL